MSNEREGYFGQHPLESWELLVKGVVVKGRDIDHLQPRSIGSSGIKAQFERTVADTIWQRYSCSPKREERDKEILAKKLGFFDPDNIPTNAQLAREYGVTRERIRQILNREKRFLRSTLEAIDRSEGQYEGMERLHEVVVNTFGRTDEIRDFEISLPGPLRVRLTPAFIGEAGRVYVEDLFLVAEETSYREGDQTVYKYASLDGYLFKPEFKNPKASELFFIDIPAPVRDKLHKAGLYHIQDLVKGVKNKTQISALNLTENDQVVSALLQLFNFY